MTKHTPGPWQSQDDLKEVLSSDIYWVYGPDERLVANTFTPGRTMAECRANGRVIKAAPDMLGALEAWMALDDMPQGWDRANARIKAMELRDAALKKAKGEIE